MGNHLTPSSQAVTKEQRAALDTLVKAAQDAERRDRWEEAIRLFRQARTLAEPLPPVEASNMIHEVARVFRSNQQFPEALAAYQELERHARQHGLTVRASSALVFQGSVYASLGQPDSARVALQRGQRLLDGLDDRPALYSCLVDGSFVYLKLGEHDEAIRALQGAQKLYPNAPQELTCLTYQAGIYEEVGQYQKALELLFRTFSRKETSDPEGAATALLQIGRIYYKQRAVSSALLFTHDALRRAERLNNHGFVGQLLEQLAEFSEEQGELAQSCDYRLQALALAQKHELPRLEVTVQTRLGYVWALRRNRERALAALSAALQRAQELRLPYEENNVLYYQAAVHEELGDLPMAGRLLEKLIASPQTDKTNRAGALDQLAKLRLKLRELPVARRCAQEARTLYQQLTSRTLEAKGLGLLGSIEYQAGDYRAAERAYQQALVLIEQLRGDVGQGMSGQATFFESLQDVYRGYLTLLTQERRFTEAFSVAQKMKARGLLELMVAGRANLSRGLTTEEQAQERRLHKRCELLAEAMVGEAARNVPGSKKRFTALKSELVQAERELSVFQDTLYAKYTGLDQRRAATTVSLETLARALPTRAALLEFAPLAADRLALFVVTRSARGKVEVTASPLAVSQQELERRIAALRAACTSPKKPWQGEAKRLYAALLAPVEAQLRGKTQLIVCPDRTLWDVPFAVLTDKSGTPLLERFALSYANSATTWHAAQTTPHKPSASPKLLVLANPQFDAEKRFETGTSVPGERPITVPDRPITVPDRPITVPDRPITVPDRPITVPDRPITVPDRDLFLPRGTRLVDLPGTQREADALAKRFPSATVYTRAQAQESVVKQKASKFQRLHLASHAFVNDAAPLLSSVVLANPTPGSGDDGFLTAREIFDLDLSGVELAVLSACNTARGATQGGEGVIGLTWALFAAGCPTQVLSQWAVDDSSTATLMTRFYDGLAQNVGKSEALRRAALAVRKESKYAHPYFWAPFVLLGDPR